MNDSLRQLRIGRDIKQVDLAKTLDITNDYLSSIERGAKTPSFKLAKKIADYFDTTVDEIFFNNQSNELFKNNN
ncbi:helix-turn-helix domain-containing protein [Clostridium sp.]|uniref:helix-turn-helix transcriptional regulator n=1 Tax=Clostridium sp. TaxID=1506 RepID=UPI002623EA44|nr:helix-turn-helix domain-containing protein [Clostridium sp.]